MSFTRAFDGYDPRGRDPSIPRFHMEAVLDEVATAREGRPIYREEERVQILTPGSVNQPVFQVNDGHRQRWATQYEAFKRGQSAAVEGTPLEQWPGLTKAQVLELKALEVHTVEQCAGLSDVACQRIKMAGYVLRERAKAYLDDAAAQALTDRLARESEEKDVRIAALENQVAQLGELCERLQGQIMTAANAPHPIATHIPAQHDPMEAARMAIQPHGGEQSSLASLAPPKRRARAEAVT